MVIDAIEREIDRNFDHFVRHLTDYLPEHRGQFALLRNCEVLHFFSNPEDAEREGGARFPDGLFSIQEVTDSPVDLGYMNYAVGAGANC